MSTHQLDRTVHCDPPASTESDEPTFCDHADTPNACEPFEGDLRRYREIAAHREWVDNETDRPELSWPSPTCGTPRCLNLSHLCWSEPKTINYPAGVCVYCGLSADTKDHLLPRTWTGDAARKNVIVVPSCRQCNAAISDRYVMAVNERRKIAHNHIRKRASRLLKMPKWTPDEIAELGPTLRSSVERGVHDRRVAEARLAWPEDSTYDMRAMHKSGIENPYAIGLLT